MRMIAAKREWSSQSPCPIGSIPKFDTAAWKDTQGPDSSTLTASLKPTPTQGWRARSCDAAGV